MKCYSQNIRFLTTSLALLFLSLVGCNDNNHAGVITETESGKTVAGLVQNSEGTAITNATVSLMDTNFIACRSGIKFVSTTDAQGHFSLDSVPAGIYAILIQDSTANLAAYLRAEVTGNDSLDTQNIGTTTLISTAHIAIDIASFNLNENDTICLLGTLTCKVVDVIAKARHILTLNQVPTTSFSSIAVLKSPRASEDSLAFESISVHWNVLAGKSYFATTSVFRPALFHLTRTLPDTLQTYIAGADSIPFPLWLSNSVNTPLLMDDSGRVLPLEAVTISGDSTLYWALAPQIDFSASTTTSYLVFDSTQTSIVIPASPLRYALHMESSDGIQQYTTGVWGNALNMTTTASPYVMTDFEAFVDSSAMSLAFWVKLSSTAFGEDSNVVLISAMEDGVGFVIEQISNQNYQSIGVILAVQTDTGIVVDSTYGPSLLLDNTWHHYAVIINNNRICVLLNGKVIHHKTAFTEGKFKASRSPTIGGDPMIKGLFDEVMFFTGTQDTTWMQLLYQLQRPNQVEWSKDSLQ